MGSDEWIQLTTEELSIVEELDNMDKEMQSHEAKFLDDVLKKLEEYGDDNARFSQKQRDWIHGLDRKYLGT